MECIFQPLIWQIFTGHSELLNPTMWFQTTLFIITILFYTVFYSQKSTNKSILICSIFAIISLFAVVTGINFKVFGNLRYELKYPLGRTFEMIPIATLGLVISHYKLFETINNHKKYYICLFSGLVICAFILTRKNIFTRYDFGYGNPSLIVAAIAVVGLFSLIDLKNIPLYIKKFINNMSQYSLGVYCIHRLIGKYLIMFLNSQNIIIDGFILCIIIYILSVMLCKVISYIPGRIGEKMVK